MKIIMKLHSVSIVEEEGGPAVVAEIVTFLLQTANLTVGQTAIRHCFAMIPVMFYYFAVLLLNWSRAHDWLRLI